MSEWNDAILAAQARLLEQAVSLGELKKPDDGTVSPPPPVPSSDCLHVELTFDNGDYLIICHTCGNRWVMVKLGRESGNDQNGQLVGGDVSLANKGAAAGLSGQRRMKP
jgi:hypothetical protein